MNKYTIVLTREGDGRYTVSVPALPGCHSWGDTIEEAKEMAQDAIELYIEDLRSRQQAPPKDSVIISSVEVA